MSAKTGWTRVTFGDVVRQVKDRTDPEQSGLERYVAGEHMDTDDLRIRRWGTIGDGYLGPAFHMRFKPGHVLYGSRRTYLRKVAVADFEGITANTTFVLESKDPRALLPEFLPFVMQTEAFHEHAIKQSKGSVNPYINFSDLTWFDFLLPSLDEQRRIVTVCAGSQCLRDSLAAQLAATSALLLALIADFDASARRSLVRLSDVVDGLEAGSSPSAQNRPAVDGEYGVLKVSAVGDWQFVASENKAVSAERFDPRAAIRQGDLLVTRANADPHSVGRTCIVKDDHDRLMLSDKTWRLRLASHHGFDPYAVLGWTKGPTFRRHVLNQLSGTDAKNISQARLLAAPFPSLHRDALAAFGRQVRTILNAKAHVSTRVAEANAMFISWTNRAVGR